MHTHTHTPIHSSTRASVVRLLFNARAADIVLTPSSLIELPCPKTDYRDRLRSAGQETDYAGQGNSMTPQDFDPLISDRGALARDRLYVYINTICIHTERERERERLLII